MLVRTRPKFVESFRVFSRGDSKKNLLDPALMLVTGSKADPRFMSLQGS